MLPCIRVMLAALAALLSVVFLGRDASALSCRASTLGERFDGSAAVFVGRVTRNAVEDEVQKITFRVEEAFKGLPASDPRSGDRV